MRVIVVKNQSGEQRTYAGQIVEDAAEYTVQQFQIPQFQTDWDLLADIASGDADISNGVAYFADANKATAYLQATDIEPTDSDGNKYAPLKIAPAGWTYMACSFELETSNLTGLVDNDHTGTNNGYVTASYYNDLSMATACSDQTDANSNCVKSVFDFIYPSDIGLKGGFINILADPAEDVCLTVIGLRNYAAGAAAVTFINNINLRYLTDSERLNIDGKTIKILPYNGGIGTNEISFLVNHPAGSKHKIACVLEFYHP